MNRDTAEPSRRHLLATAALVPLLPALGVLGGCASAPLSPIQAKETTDPAALTLFNECAAAHGLTGWRRVRDVNVGYRGEWSTLASRVQPERTDTRFRSSLQERLLPAEGLIAQAHTGPAGQKQVLRRLGQGVATGSVEVWYNGRPTTDEPLRQTSAMVADTQRLCLLGPLALVDRPQVMKLAGLEQVGDHACERLMVRMVPGLGLSPVDQLVMCIDRRTRLMRRVRFTMDGAAVTRGAAVEVDVSEFQNFQGVEWPTRFRERMRRPVPLLPMHDWQLTGLDLNRGWSAADIGGAQFTGLAQGAARALPGSPAPAG